MQVKKEPRYKGVLPAFRIKLLWKTNQDVKNITNTREQNVTMPKTYPPAVALLRRTY